MATMLRHLDGKWHKAACPYSNSPCDDRCVHLMRVGETDKFVCADSVRNIDEKADMLGLKINFLKQLDKIEDVSL